MMEKDLINSFYFIDYLYSQIAATIVNKPKDGTNFMDVSKRHFSNESFLNNDKNSNLNRSLQAVGGLLLTGAGLSMSIDAGSIRTKGDKWFWYGTAALVVFQAGLCLVAGSAHYGNQK